MNLYGSIEETKDSNNKKFNDVKEQVLIFPSVLLKEQTGFEAGPLWLRNFLKTVKQFSKIKFYLVNV